MSDLDSQKNVLQAAHPYFRSGVRDEGILINRIPKQAVERPCYWLPRSGLVQCRLCAAAHLRYLDANLKIKEKALSKTMPINTKAGRYQPDDDLLAFLKVSKPLLTMPNQLIALAIQLTAKRGFLCIDSA